MLPPKFGLPHVVTVPPLCKAAKAPSVARICSTLGGILEWGCPQSLDTPQLRTSPFLVRAANEPLVLIMLERHIQDLSAKCLQEPIGPLQ